MGSLGGELTKMKAMWLYPKVIGFNPSERWGHSACYSDGYLYVFGGCCGGMHFSDILVLNLDTMAWNTLATTGKTPGPRDSHSSVLLGHMMMVFGGTNGSKKVNDLHILDLRSREWTRPECKGVPPSPRESHTATLVGDEKVVIFGGSGEGVANYLNDVHVLDLKTMKWTSPEVKGDLPVARDSHSAVAIGNKLFLYGGDCGDRYQGDIDMLDMDTFTWSRFAVQGLFPRVRAGHAAVNLGTKVYITGGVGDKQYYNDVWILDISTRSWTQLEIYGPKPQGRFSHTAIITNSNIVIYGGCGEDERPLNQLLILQLGAEHYNGGCNISTSKIFGGQTNQEISRLSERTIFSSNDLEVIAKDARQPEFDVKRSFLFTSDNLHTKKRKAVNSKMCVIEPDEEEHSLTLSQHSSPSQSDQEQTPVKQSNNSKAASKIFPLLKQQNHMQSSCQSNNISIDCLQSQKTIIRRPFHDPAFFVEDLSHKKPEYCRHIPQRGRHEMHPAAEQKSMNAVGGQSQNMIGAEIHGKVDGAFDSGYLMTASVNGKIFRGVLFAPGPEIMSRGGILGQNTSPLMSQAAVNQSNPSLNHTSHSVVRLPKRPITSHQAMEANRPFRQHQVNRSSGPPLIGKDLKLKSELQGVVLTLGSVGTGLDKS